MKKLTLFLLVTLCILSMTIASSESPSTHSASCSGNHHEFVMVDESSADFDTNATRQICGGFWGSPKIKIAMFPSHAVDGNTKTALTTIEPLEGGFDGIFYIEEASQLELIIIPDTYSSISYLAPLAGKLQYVSLPNNDSFSVSKNRLMFNEHIGLAFLVVEDSAAHAYCINMNLPYAFRKEYCHYVNEDGVFDSDMFYQDIPNMITPNKEAAHSGIPLSASTSRLYDSSLNIYPYIDGALWGYLDVEGNVAIEPQYSYAGTVNAGVYIVGIGAHFGLIDGNGAALLPIEYESLEYITNDFLNSLQHTILFA